ncbi:MAG: non-canonical purine NTP pyrophosphatase, RdgB/HAM1 family [Candidatus Marinimicrobia bacterium]|nr:non-canonical purine NTP pyrophosphatase, RdgB/HAM1 family [Candidatus Neomarinimicrobiota bacterium]|tara:strand:+ start:2711 stop:3310 length:600 start_codon:yes stop_codon:yes gene_type:complete
MVQKKIVLATHNQHKRHEMNRVLSSMGITIVGLNDFPQIGDIEETGKTLLENAFIKARKVFELTGIPSIADDTGLEVNALDGAPGLFSARYAGENPTYEDNINKLMLALEGVPKEKRNAKFRTIIAFVDFNKELHSEGIAEGVITEIPEGRDGFGYDPIFKPNNFNKTYAEMDIEQKNKISHRGRALKKMKKLLINYLK